jgi:8-oxo-dGTP pyrophosphatase MutT (NUDIX family)
VALHEYPIDPEDQAEMLAWLEGRHPDPVGPRGASTVLLLRDGVSDVEVFLLRRRASMAFAPRMHAFPGGGVDPRDSDGDVPWVGPSPAEWGAALHCPESLATALVCAAVRELFEECGVLLAGGDAGGPVVADVSGEDWERDRLALLDRSLSLSDLLARRGLHLRSDLLRAWAHWTTPEFEPRRFDTWFFVAALPVGQQARDIGGEADRASWVGISELVAGQASGRLAMFPPTGATVADVVAAVRNRPSDVPAIASVLAAPRQVRRVMPWLARTSDGAAVMLVDLDGRGGGRPGPKQHLTALP